jgi:hypothetical protein
VKDDSDEEEEDLANVKEDKNYIGEHVFLTSNPYEEEEDVEETDPAKGSDLDCQQITQKDSSLMNTTINDRRKLNAIKKHNAFRLRNQLLKVKGKEELPLHIPVHLDIEQQSIQEPVRDNSSSPYCTERLVATEYYNQCLTDVHNSSNISIEKKAEKLHVQDSLTNLIGDDKYSNYNDGSSSRNKLNDNYDNDDQHLHQNEDFNHHQLQESPLTLLQNTQFNSSGFKADPRRQLDNEHEQESLDDSDDIYTQNLFQLAHQQSMLLEQHEYSLQVHYLCLIGRGYVFYVGHVDKIMKPFSML